MLVCMLTSTQRDKSDAPPFCMGREYTKPAVSVFMFRLDVVEIYECSL